MDLTEDQDLYITHSVVECLPIPIVIVPQVPILSSVPSSTHSQAMLPKPVLTPSLSNDTVEMVLQTQVYEKYVILDLAMEQYVLLDTEVLVLDVTVPVP